MSYDKDNYERRNEDADDYRDDRREERGRPRHRFSIIRLFKGIFAFVIILAIAFFLYKCWPYISERIFGSGSTQWISERFSETLKEKNELVVYEIETTGQETVTETAWLVGTVQKVEMPYTFTLNYTVDLSKATVRVEGNTVVVGVPKPQPTYHKLVADDENMRKSDFFYPLTPERYSDIKRQTEQKLYNEYSANDDIRRSAWNKTVANLESLFQSVVEERSGMGAAFTVRIEQIVPTETTSSPDAEAPADAA